MNSKEKIELLKDTIYQLYSKEGRSKLYISKLLGVNRKYLSEKINEWKFEDPEPMRHMSPSSEKFINNNRTFIKSQLDKDIPVTDIARSLRCSTSTILNVAVVMDPVLEKAFSDYKRRKSQRAKDRLEQQKAASSRQYDQPDLDGEEWKPILGYPDYEVSNMGRIRRYIKTYDSYYIMKPEVLHEVCREYIRIVDKDRKSHNLQVSRLVAHAFCDGFDDVHNTVNHKDGNTLNNKASNLEWMSMSENNKHAYDYLNRSKVRGKTLVFDVILYQDKFEFKTVASFAKFIGKSETQTRRWIQEQPDEHNIKLIVYDKENSNNTDNCND